MVIHIGKPSQPQPQVQQVQQPQVIQQQPQQVQQQPVYQQPVQPQPIQYQQAPQQMPPIQQAQPIQDNRVRELEEQNKTLENINYFNGLADEKTFRFELIQAINRIALLLNNLNEKIDELASEEEEVK